MMKTPEDAKNCDCCVVTGLDSNVQGIADTSTQAPVITASGMTADEICGEVEKNFIKEKTEAYASVFLFGGSGVFKTVERDFYFSPQYAFNPPLLHIFCFGNDSDYHF